MTTIPMTVMDVARALEVSADTVRELERTGRLPATKTRLGWRLFDPADVKRLAQKRAERKGAPR